LIALAFGAVVAFVPALDLAAAMAALELGRIGEVDFHHDT
jgi:hypothetical protein